MPGQQLLGPGSLAQAAVVAKATRHAAHSFQIAAGVLQVQHYQACGTPGRAPALPAATVPPKP